jgi:hypothetical protein
MQFVCSDHGPQPLVGVSARFDAAPQRAIPAEWACLVVVRGTEGVSWHLLDVEAVAAAGLDPRQSPLTLYDRDRAARQLNDRLLIQALIPSQPPRTMCRACLMQAVAPADAPHLRLPLGLWWPHPTLADA